MFNWIQHQQNFRFYVGDVGNLKDQEKQRKSRKNKKRTTDPSLDHLMSSSFSIELFIKFYKCSTVQVLHPFWKSSAVKTCRTQFETRIRGRTISSRISQALRHRGRSQRFAKFHHMMLHLTVTDLHGHGLPEHSNKCFHFCSEVLSDNLADKKYYHMLNFSRTVHSTCWNKGFIFLT